MTDKKRKLLDRLREAVADEREIEHVVSGKAEGSTRYCGDDRIEYLKSNGSVYAVAKFKNGQISELIAGPALSSKSEQDALVAAARRQCGSAGGDFVATRVLFADRPLTGMFHWRDDWRISMCDLSQVGKGLAYPSLEALRMDEDNHLGPPYPFLLEVKVGRSENGLIESTRSLRRLDEVQFILTLLISGKIRYAHWPNEKVWASLWMNERVEYHLVQPSFGTPENGRLESFPARKQVSARTYDKDDPDYYNHLWFSASCIELPATLGKDFALYRQLPNAQAKAFLRACYWYSVGLQNSGNDQVSGLAFSAAIECLLPAIDSINCLTCDRPLAPGPTKLFNEHLKRYGTLPEQLYKRRSKLYQKRSAMIHGQHAPRIDIGFFSLAHSRDDAMLLELVTRRSLVNWLRDSDRSTWHLSLLTKH